MNKSILSPEAIIEGRAIIDFSISSIKRAGLGLSMNLRDFVVTAPYSVMKINILTAFLSASPSPILKTIRGARGSFLKSVSNTSRRNVCSFHIFGFTYMRSYNWHAEMTGKLITSEYNSGMKTEQVFSTHPAVAFVTMITCPYDWAARIRRSAAIATFSHSSIAFNNGKEYWKRVFTSNPIIDNQSDGKRVLSQSKMITLFLENSIGVSTRGGIHSVEGLSLDVFPMKTDGVGVRGGVGGGEGGNAARSNAGIG